jgi:hypothetical protein
VAFKSPTPKRSAVVILGLLFLLAAFFPFVNSRTLARSRDWHTVIAPLSFQSGTIQHVHLGKDLNGKYEIDIEFQDVSSPEHLGCLAGNARFDPVHCVGAPDIVDASWKLYENERLVQEGNSSDYLGVVFSSPIIERRIGQFRAVKPRDYSLVVSVNRDASQLDSAHPKIKVQVPMDAMEGYYLGVAIEQIETIILCFVGALVVLAALYVRKPSE